MLNLRGNKYLVKVLASIITLLILNVVVFFEHPKNDNLLRVYFLDIGQGDSILIETPNKAQIMIDAGPNNSVINQLSEVLPFFDRTIDIIIPTHSDLDHVGGFPEILRRFQIKNYFDSGYEDGDDLNKEIRLLVQNEDGITSAKIARSDNIILDKEHNINLEILWPPANFEAKDNNDRSIVARLDYGETSFLFTGDAPIDVEQKLISTATNGSTSTKNILDVDILKAGHHGSRTSSSLEFLKAVTPELTIISTGKDNRYGHPHKEVLDNLAKVNSKIENTAEAHRILIESDGKTYWVKKQNLFNQTSFLQSLISTILVKSS